MTQALSRIAGAMGMSPAVWRRHANPWSVWTRFSCLPLIVLALWSRDWIGGWSLLALAVALVWTWANPRVFAEPTSFDTWAGRAVMGERIHIYRPDQVAAHHVMPLRWLTWSPAIGLVPLVWGVWMLNLWAVLAGLFITVMLKVWFCDRMVWIALEWRAAGHDWADLDR